VDWVVLLIFVFVYLGMILGFVPGLKLDRTGVALIGAIALLAFGRLSAEDAWRAIDVPTIGLLFGLMVVSAQFRLGGFYSEVTRRIASLEVGPAKLLLLVILVAGVLSALLTNDIVCLAVTPLLVEGCARRKLNPLPYLLGLACASNVGSAATLIGNPQIMLIGQRMNLSFAGYLLDGGVPAALGLIATWAVIASLYRGRWHAEFAVPEVQAPPFNRYQTAKGAAVLALLVLAFLFLPALGRHFAPLNLLSREVLALMAAGIVLLSRRMHSRDMLGLVDWQLLVLFIGLFIVNHALAAPPHGDPSGLPMLDRGMRAIRDAGVDVKHPAWLFVLTTILSNMVSNVPAVMLLLPTAHDVPLGGPILALSSTLAGNLFLVGSIANLIVAGQADSLGVRVTWKEHARVGVPVTLVTMAIAAAWLWWRA
jgi:Na+/H+ antiporter NhaD/arsenite permease-like protein